MSTFIYLFRLKCGGLIQLPFITLILYVHVTKRKTVAKMVCRQAQSLCGKENAFYSSTVQNLLSNTIGSIYPYSRHFGKMAPYGFHLPSLRVLVVLEIKMYVNHYVFGHTDFFFVSAQLPSKPSYGLNTQEQKNRILPVCIVVLFLF